MGASRRTQAGTRTRAGERSGSRQAREDSERVLAGHEHVVVRTNSDDRGRAGGAERDALGLARAVRDLTEPEGELRVVLGLTSRINVVHHVASSLRGGGDRMGGPVGAEERVRLEHWHDRVERIVHGEVHHGPATCVGKRIGHRRVDREGVVLGQLAPADYDSRVAEFAGGSGLAIRFLLGTWQFATREHDSHREEERSHGTSDNQVIHDCDCMGGDTATASAKSLTTTGCDEWFPPRSTR